MVEYIDPQVLKFWQDLWTLYYGDICRCYITQIEIIEPLEGYRVSTGRCSLCGLSIGIKMMPVYS